MSKHSSFADDMPELYPTGTAKKRDEQIDNAEDRIDAALAKHKGPLTAKQKHEILKNAGFSVGWRGEKAEVFIASPVAPELDSWIILGDDPPPVTQRSLDDDWES